MRRALTALLAGAALVLLAACGSGGTSADRPRATSTPTGHATPSDAPAAATTAPAKSQPLRPGERRVTVRMPSAYTPSAPTGVGTDDYRCFLLDPKVARDSFVTGFNVRPGNPEVVHHVILFRVPPDLVDDAERKDAATPGEGWTCFGTSGLADDGSIDDAPWLGAWAPGGSEQLYGNGLGEKFDTGSRVIMQVHYNLLAGSAPDTSAAELRLTSDPATKALETRLIPAPVELPCRSGHGGDLCDRDEALADVKARFGDGPGSTANYLHFLCGGGPAGPVQSCTREISSPETIRGVAGHMHLLGRSIRIEVDPGTPKARTILDIPVWDFDNQRSVATPPIHLDRGDTVKVTCTHSQDLRDQLPAFATQREDRYVMWGEGTTDEMCLGLLLVTRP
ncbi:putative small lipoprotein YifL [Marmoricola sp. URHA0025 HA25]